jgi:hypothetical protein
MTLDRAYEAVTFPAPPQPATYAEVGPMLTGGDIEAAVTTVLRAWMPGYLAECERQHGDAAGSIPVPRGWAITGRDLQKLNSDQLPCIVVMAGGIIQPPRKQGAPGSYTASWSVDIGAVFSAAWGRASRQHAQAYAAAVRGCMIQRPMRLPLGSTIAAVDWRGEVYDEMDFADSRTYSASVCAFDLQVVGVAWADGGPPPDAGPPTDPTIPFLDWVTVVETDITVDHLPKEDDA